MVNFVSLTVLYILICQVPFRKSQSLEHMLEASEPDYTTDLVEAELDLISENKNSRNKQLNFSVLLYYVGKYRCLSSLISDRLILTAIDCVKKDGVLQDPVYFSGRAPKAEDCIIPQCPIHFESIHVHPEGNLAILLTKKVIEFDKGVGQICLSNDTKEIVNQDAVATTITTDSHNKSNLKYSHVKVVKNSRCSIQGTTKMCVYAGNTTFCKGDSGGPLIVTNKKDVNLQVGVLLRAAIKGRQTHNGKECSNLGIYDKVSHYRKFILEIAKRSNSSVCFVPF